MAASETEKSHASVLDHLSLTARAVVGGWLAGLPVYFVHSGGVVSGLRLFEDQPKPSILSFVLPAGMFLALVTVWRRVRSRFRDAYTSTPWSAAYSGASAAILFGLAGAVIIYLSEKGISTPMCLTILGLEMCGIVALVVECEAAWLRVCREQHAILAPRWLAAIAGGAWCVCAYMALASYSVFDADAVQPSQAGESHVGSPAVAGVMDTRQATLNAWSELQEAIMTMHEADGPKTSVRFNRLARDLSRLTASNTDPT